MAERTNALVLFDLVSTLTDAGPRYAEAYVRMTEDYGVTIPDRDDIIKELGNRNLMDIIERHSPDLPADRVKSFMSDCNTACDALLYDVNWIERLFPHVREALTSLSVQKYTLGLFTGTREDAMQSQIRYHNIAQYFDPSLIRGKNNQRDGFTPIQDLKIAQLKSLVAAFRADHGDVVPVIVVGDSVSDYHAARTCGAVFVGFAENWKKALDMKEAGIGTTFDNYKELPNILSVLTSHYAPQSSLRAGFGCARTHL